MDPIGADRRDRRRHGSRIPVHQIAIDSWLHIVFRPAAAGADHGHAAGHRFEGSDAQTLLVGGNDKHIKPLEHRGQLLAIQRGQTTGDLGQAPLLQALLQDGGVHLTHQIELNGTAGGHQGLDGIEEQIDVLAGIGIAARESHLPGLEALWGREKHRGVDGHQQHPLHRTAGDGFEGPGGIGTQGQDAPLGGPQDLAFKAP